MEHNILSGAIEVVGLKEVAAACGVSYQAVRKWESKNRFPRTEFTGETDYAARIAAACKAADPQSQITREALLGLPAVTSHDRHVVTGQRASA